MIVEDQVFTGRTVEVDDTAFNRCTFTNCILKFSGGHPPRISGCVFNDCSWALAGPAAATLDYLTGLYGNGMAHIVERTFDNIRAGKGGESIAAKDRH